MKKKRLIVLLATCVLIAAMTLLSAPVQTTQPAADGRLEYRASRAFDSGDYATALPLLRKLVDELKDKPAKKAMVQDHIKVCENALAKSAGAAAGSAPPIRTIHQPPPAGQVLNLAIKELGNFDYDADKGGNIPDDVKRLSGCRIRLKGFMMPIDQSEKITRFALVPSLFSCCFGQPPQVQHTIIVSCPKGKEAEFSPDEVLVEGTLHVEERRDDGYIVSIFEVAASSIANAPK